MRVRSLMLFPVGLLGLVACGSERGLGNLLDTDSGFVQEDPDDSGGGGGEEDTDQVPGEPISRAGPDAVVPPLSEVRLDGSQSTDPSERYPLTYAWRLSTVPPGSTAAISDPSSTYPSFFADIAGIYVAELAVTNDAGVVDSTPDKVTIEAKPTDGFYVQLTWSTAATDLDLHLLREPDGLWDEEGDCNYCNQEPEWGDPGGHDNPSLDNDAQDGFGPETITISAPAAGRYRVNVHYFGESGMIGECWDDPCPATLATINIYSQGQLIRTLARGISGASTVWDAATIEWPSGTITEHDSTFFDPIGFCGG